jgi:hypothetical protein
MLNYGVEDQLKTILKNHPVLVPYKKYVKYLISVLLNFLLDLNYYVSVEYTPLRFEEEMKGMAAGTKG